MPRPNASAGRPSDPKRGLTYQDLNVGTYGYTNIPEDVRTSQSMVSRGSEKVGKLPDMGYVVNRKSDVWSDNVAELYEEVKARRWVPATDIPWTELHDAAARRTISRWRARSSTPFCRNARSSRWTFRRSGSRSSTRTSSS